MHRLPPLNALRAFEAAARHLSIKQAAAELFVTPTAVSHQVKALERNLGVRLFQRHPQGLTLTERGRQMLPLLTQGFAALAAAVGVTGPGEETRQVLTLDVAPSFAAKWLTPRLAGFFAAHPDIELRIAARQSLVQTVRAEGGASFGADEVSESDAAIAFGDGEFPGTVSTRLFKAQLQPYCNPAALAGAAPLTRPEDLREHVLLHDDTSFFADGRANWEAWFAHAGVQHIDASRGVHFSHAVLALEAAADGLGVALGLSPLASHDVAEGRLVTPFGPALELASSYYLVTPEVAADRREVMAFRDWVMAAATQEQEHAAGAAP